jgi:Mg2+-importing ATPase
MCAAVLATPFLGPLSSVFGFAPLSGSEIAAIFAIAIDYIAATEAAKMWFYRSPSTPAG